jgi:hypothetical protein
MALSRRSLRVATATTGCLRSTRTTVSRLGAVLVLVIVFVSGTGGVALAVVGGKTVPITAAPWTVVLWKQSPYAGRPRYAACTGVIINRLHVLTAGHCVMSGTSATPLPASTFGIEAGASNFKHPLKSDHPQFRAVSGVRTMPGYIATSKITDSNYMGGTGQDLAVLTLSRPLDLHGDDARAADLPTHTPTPSQGTRLVIAGFGNEQPSATSNPTGDLNEVPKATVLKDCSTSRGLCVYATRNTCWGDSGLGSVEPGPHPTVVGILSDGQNICAPGQDYFVSLTAPAILRFIKTST